MILSLLRKRILKWKAGRIKPCLKEENKLQRLEYALSFVDEESLQFVSMSYVVHVDEKLFYGDVDKHSYLAFEDEITPQRSRPSKHFVPKTMFSLPSLDRGTIKKETLRLMGKLPCGH
ncbi:uncharacterized protein IUM83_06667 [Phytophthora cinnamomi]|uniref:uncharacterized protein n=1 Tax=Phytophthora cinnamomi TaxID=4785 RepID=UPI0035597E50|nr:hypothetical protein IUM83_06667 [Phytophthora cinnamomi]